MVERWGRLGENVEWGLAFRVEGLDWFLGLGVLGELPYKKRESPDSAVKKHRQLEIQSNQRQIQTLACCLNFLGMARTYSFERLETWKEARKLVKWVYTVTRDFPFDEKYGMTLQLRRAAISVVSNLAEGSARNTVKDKANFYQMSYSSIIEVLNHLIISGDLDFLTEESLGEGRRLIESLTGKITSLRNTELVKLSPPQRKC